MLADHHSKERKRKSFLGFFFLVDWDEKWVIGIYISSQGQDPWFKDGGMGCVRKGSGECKKVLGIWCSICV